LSALYGLEIDNVVVECSTQELPFFDGSATPFVNELQYDISEQSVPAIYFVVSDYMTIGSRNTFICARPSKKLHLNLVMENRVIGEQQFDATVAPAVYMAEVAPARTFAIVRPDDPRLRRLPAYGIGITSQGVFSREPMRFNNEPIRHKALDLLGDLALAGGRIRGRLVGRNISHRLNHRLVKAIAAARRGVRSPPSSPLHR
jgi:UDP-3-O-acyl-N-acetylglucosamine deacetylase